MTLAEIRQRIEKGCGTIIKSANRINPFSIKCDVINLCLDCQAQLKLLDEIEGEIKKNRQEEICFLKALSEAYSDYMSGKINKMIEERIILRSKEL